MSIGNTSEQFLMKAAAAEAIADTLADGFLRQSWLDIAEGYRELAKSVATNPDNTKAPPPDAIAG